MPGLSEMEILEHLQARHDFSYVLLELSQRQRGYIADRQFSDLIDVLSRKQRILGRLDVLKQRHPEITQEWKRQREQLTPKIRTRCEALLQETEGIFAQLLIEEESCQDALQQSRDDVQRQLHEISNNRDVHNAYRSSNQSEHNKIDIGR